jgi:probable phosphoglycerate mutase
MNQTQHASHAACESAARQYIILVRHGESFANKALVLSGCGLYYADSGSDLEIGLTDRGHTQSSEVGRLIARLFPAHRPLKRVWTSHFRRTRQSADSIVDCLCYETERMSDVRLSKRDYGIFWNLTYRGVKELHPEEWERFQIVGPLRYRPPSGENYGDVFDRVDEFIEEEIDPSSGNHLIVTHSVVVLSFERTLEGLDEHEVVRRYEEIALPNAHVKIYTRSHPDEEWQAISIEQALAEL